MSILVEDIEFPSGDNELKGRIYRPKAKGVYPAVAICHGYPGDTKNMDLAEELAINNVVVLIFYYQGAWGSEGTYRFTNLVPSTLDALRYLKSQPFVDRVRVGLVSHSMGALPLTSVMVDDRTLRTGILMSPASDISRWLDVEITDRTFSRFLSMAEGKLAYGDNGEYKADMLAAARELNPIDKIDLIEAPILIVVGSADNVTRPDDCRALYDKAGQPKGWALIEGADHSFSEHRLVLQSKILDWLKANL